MHTGLVGLAAARTTEVVAADPKCRLAQVILLGIPLQIEAMLLLKFTSKRTQKAGAVDTDLALSEQRAMQEMHRFQKLPCRRWSNRMACRTSNQPVCHATTGVATGAHECLDAARGRALACDPLSTFG